MNRPERTLEQTLAENARLQPPWESAGFVWDDGCLLVNGLVFRIDDHGRHDRADHFDLYKSRPLLEQFATFRRRAELRQGGNVVELGIWDGGSAALWFEVLQPDKLVAVDISGSSALPDEMAVSSRCHVFPEPRSAMRRADRRAVY